MKAFHSIATIWLSATFAAGQCIDQDQTTCIKSSYDIPEFAFCVLQSESIVNIINTCVGQWSVAITFDNDSFDPAVLDGLDGNPNGQFELSPQKFLLAAATEPYCGVECGLGFAFSKCPAHDNERFQGCLCALGVESANITCLRNCINENVEEDPLSCTGISCLTRSQKGSLKARDTIPKREHANLSPRQDENTACEIPQDYFEYSSMLSVYSETSGMTNSAYIDYLPDATASPDDQTSTPTTATNTSGSPTIPPGRLPSQTQPSSTTKEYGTPKIVYILATVLTVLSTC